MRFDGEPLSELDPTLDMRTRRLIQGVEARVNVRGTLKQPDIVLSSTPPLEQADILSLIVFNQPINSLGEGQQVSLAQRAQAMATGRSPARWRRRSATRSASTRSRSTPRRTAAAPRR